jgi:hypothetical protein
MKSLLTLALLTAIVGTAHADINRCVNQDGGLLLTDEPCSAGARTIASLEDVERQPEQPRFFNAKEVPVRPRAIQRNLVSPNTDPAIPALNRPAPGMKIWSPSRY